jgi:hypothetical protein
VAPIQKNGVLHLDDALGVLQPMSGVVQMTADVENTTGEYAVLPTKWVRTMDGRRRFRGSFRGIAETGAVANQLRDTCRDWLLSSDKPGARSFKIECPDASPGSEEWSGEIHITNMTPMVDANAEDDGALVTTINWVGDDAISFAVIV